MRHNLTISSQLCFIRHVLPPSHKRFILRKAQTHSTYKKALKGSPSMHRNAAFWLNHLNSVHDVWHTYIIVTVLNFNICPDLMHQSIKKETFVLRYISSSFISCRC